MFAIDRRLAAIVCRYRGDHGALLVGNEQGNRPIANDNGGIAGKIAHGRARAMTGLIGIDAEYAFVILLENAVFADVEEISLHCAGLLSQADKQQCLSPGHETRMTLQCRSAHRVNRLGVRV
ncbi:hypothetical protein G8E10_13615 [Rhizobiaceae bacterium CRRU44]|uniref:Uncharacterized protein n=1 Tax=Ferranicluibacter rubi TaxID=2715133 RepID=A0AA43ZGQ2_9HYPH|nr:hypothetical protein [Ferranicluibacter rubi]